MHRSCSVPTIHRGRSIRRAAATTLGISLLFGASSSEFAQAAVVRSQNPAVTKSATTKTLASSAGYMFDLRLDMTSDGGQPARTSFRGSASLAEIDATTSRIQIQSIEMSQSDETGTARVVQLSEEFRVPLTESFDVNSNPTLQLFVGQTEPEEVTNIKRALAKQIALTPNEGQLMATQLATIRADVTDGFGTFKNRASLTRSKGKLVLKDTRTEADYTRLALPESLNPDVVVQNTNVYNQTTGQLETSQTFEAITVDYGALPASAENPTGTGRRILQSASSRMSVSKSGQGERVASPTQSLRAVPIDTVVTEEMERNAQKASAPTFDEAMNAIANEPEAPSSALGLAARLQSDPLAMVTLRKTLEGGSVAPELLPAIAAALLETNTPEAQSILATSILGNNDLSDAQRQHLALSIGSIENPSSTLLAAVRSAKNAELLSNAVQQPERPDPTECDLDPDCLPTGGGTGNPGPPPIMTFPYAKNWNQRIGNAVLGADLGANIAITRNPNTTNDFNSDVNAYAKGLVLGNQFSVVDANLKTISDRDGNRKVEASIDIRGRGRETFTTNNGCSLNLEGNLYEGTLPLFAANFWIPVGPVVFYGGASAAGYVSVPWSVEARTCGSDGFAYGNFNPNVFVEVRAYGGISIFIASAGLEAIGTIAKVTMSPSAKIRWRPTVSPEAAAEFRLQMAFQPFSLKVRAWLRVLFWTKRWTLAEWSTPLRVWVAALAQTANWSRVNHPDSRTLAVGPPLSSKALVSAGAVVATTQQTTTSVPTIATTSRAKPVSVQSVTVPPSAPATTVASESTKPPRSALPTTTPPTTTPPITVPSTKLSPPVTTVPPTTTSTTTTSSTTIPVTKTTSVPGTKPASLGKPVERATDSSISAETEKEETIESKV
jgi:hypothetical protein